MLRILQTCAGCVALISLVSIGSEGVDRVSAAEQSDRSRILFDGTSLDAWKGFKTDKVGSGWQIVDGTLHRAGQGGDLVTKEQFGDFELTLDWKVGGAGNSGIFFRGLDEGDAIWHSAPEMQILNNAVHADGKNPLTSAGSNYAVHAPVRDVTKPIGEWNSVRLIVKGAHVEQWLNGVKVVDYELWSPDWEARVKKSKFIKYPKYGRATRGHIGLQDHGDPVWFRNIRVREL